MTREEKNKCIDDLATQLAGNATIYLADVSELNADQSEKLRRLCFNKQVSLRVVKNTLLKKAIEKVEDKDLSDFNEVLVGNTSLMFAEAGNAPAKLIKEFRVNNNKPLLKGAFIEETIYLGDEQLEMLAGLKTKNELVADIVLALQSPVMNVMSALQSGGNTLTGLLKTLSEKKEDIVAEKKETAAESKQTAPETPEEDKAEGEDTATVESADDSASETTTDAPAVNEDELKTEEAKENVQAESKEAEASSEEATEQQEKQEEPGTTDSESKEKSE